MLLGAPWAGSADLCKTERCYKLVAQWQEAQAFQLLLTA
jgi:hypothetical protein